MAWPNITDFTDAIQNPGLCFKGTAYETGAVSVNQRGMPLVFSGAFACVYPVTVGGRKLAVRCFTREVRDQRERYNQLSEYLVDVLPPSFVNFQYLVQGISLRGEWYPVVMMEWVEGVPLSSFVDLNLSHPNTLRQTAAQWRGGPAAGMRGLGIAHNDLQHGNVMVQADGRIRLVDYDGMFLPRFRGERSPELGHKNFQHPLRAAEDYDAYVDNFPSLVIYLSLLATASDPDLWSYHNEDNLLFTRSDFAEPAESRLFSRLEKSTDPAVAKLTERLAELCRVPVAEVPDLETILQAIPPGARRPAGLAAPVGPPPVPAGKGPPKAAPPRPIRQIARIAAPAVRPPVRGPAPRPRPSLRAVLSSLTSTLLLLAGLAKGAIAALSRGSTWRELAKVLLGVLATVAVVALAMAGAALRVVSQGGW